MENAAVGHIDNQGKKVGMWLFLFTELLFFGGMFLLYSIFRSRYPAEFHAAAGEENLLLGTINTVILLVSSCAIAMAIAAIRNGNRHLSVWLQFFTIGCGVFFLAIKYGEWTAKIGAGLYPDSAVLLALGKGTILFFSLYYVMTGLHGLHVLIGIAVIAYMSRLTMQEKITRNDFAKLENTGLYWHFVDIVWIYLFPLFYLIT